MVDETFKINPLQEVSMEMRFPINLEIASKIARFQEKIKEEYTILEREEISSIDHTRTIKYIFRNQSEDKQIEVDDTSFSFIVNQYESYRVFLLDALRKIGIFREVFNVQYANSLRLRYINNIIIPSQGESLDLISYVKPYIDIGLVTSTHLERFAAQILLDTGDSYLASVGALTQDEDLGGQAGRNIYILDLDAISKEKRIAVEEINIFLDRLHQVITEEFLKVITDEYLQELREE